MKISCHWLKDYVSHTLAPSELSARLTMSGLEVEEELFVGAALDGVVVGHILEAVRHPNADRLTLCQVGLGHGKRVQIACGAPNVATGQKVAVATVGSVLSLPDRSKPQKIKRAKVRGAWSEGMICAEDELGLSGDHSGIMVLDPDAVPGSSLASYLDRAGITTEDTILDLAITPNRPDATCHYGVARDVGALCDLPLRRPFVPVPAAGGEVAERLSVTISCPQKCRRYVAMMVQNVVVGESPLWLRRRLEAIGLRPINSVVDVTNYVMHECGQPLHAFDFDEIADHAITVRESAAGEMMITLDGKARVLPDGAVLICDGQRPVAIGGIMGGENSEVTAATSNVLLESAYFDPSATRRTARTLGLNTDASYRFERGIDSEGQAWAAARAAALIADIAGGTVVDGMIDRHPNPTDRPVLSLRLGRIPKILGTIVAAPEVERILTALGFDVSEKAPGILHCRVPAHRPDVSREIDLIEEVARIYGLDKIPMPGATQMPGTVPNPRPSELLRSDAYAMLGGRGYREIYTNSLLSRAEALEFCDPVLAAKGDIVETVNAVSQSMTTLRPSLLPGVLQVMGHNQNHGQEILRFFEFGHVFQKVEGSVAYIPGYLEYEALILAISGPIGPPEWGEKRRTADYFDLKGDVEILLEALHVPEVRIEPLNEPSALTDYHAAIYADDAEIARMARLAAPVSTARDIRDPVYFAEFNWTRLVLHAQDHMAHHYQPINRYPAVTRDISVVVDRSVPADDMMKTIRASGRRLLLNAVVFDLYEETKDRNKKSIAFSLRFGALRTLRDHEVEKAVRRIVRSLHEKYGAQLRGPTA